jgi:hypothetical protein
VREILLLACGSKIGYLRDIILGVGSYSIRARVRGKKSDLDVEEELLLNGGGGVVGTGGELPQDVEAPLPDLRCSAHDRVDGFPRRRRRSSGAGAPARRRPRRQTVTAHGEPSMR